jgi:hypothetical protein
MPNWPVFDMTSLALMWWRLGACRGARLPHLGSGWPVVGRQTQGLMQHLARHGRQ